MPIIKSINPFNEEINAEFETISREQLDEKIKLANDCFLEWKNIDIDYKKGLYLKLADIIEDNYEELAKLWRCECFILIQKLV